MGQPYLSIVIPAYNEEARIVSTLEKVGHYLGGQPYTWEVLVVDDGSSDATAALAGRWAGEHPGFALMEASHRGKGWAVRQGMLSSSGRLRFMCDADLAMPIAGLAQFLQRMEEGWDIVVGSRQIAGARRFDEPWVRHLLGRLFNWVVRGLTVRGLQDTQCGFKCFTAEAAESLFALQRTEGFGFDVEVLYLARKQGMRVVEVPIDWFHQKASKVRPGVDSFLMLRDAALSRWRHRGDGGRQEDGGVATRGSTAEDEALPAGDGSIAVVVPTYNEAANLPELAERLFGLGLPDLRLLVVDDNSPDGTAETARALSRRFQGKVSVVERESKQGLGTAYVAGFSRALADGADYIIEMDADLSHAPEYVPALLEELKRSDVVVGSRYVPGGGADARRGLGRRFMSYIANAGIRMVAGVTVKDATSGFKGFRATALRSLGLTRFRCKGFGFQTEVARACQNKDHRVVEYPIVFVDRTEGRSKMSAFIVLEALWHLLLLRWRS